MKTRPFPLEVERELRMKDAHWAAELHLRTGTMLTEKAILAICEALVDGGTAWASLIVAV